MLLLRQDTIPLREYWRVWQSLSLLHLLVSFIQNTDDACIGFFADKVSKETLDPNQGEIIETDHLIR